MTNNQPKNRKRDRSKSISSVQPRSYSQYFNKGEGASAGTVAQSVNSNLTTRTATDAGKGSETVNWQNEYDHVLGDLRTLLIVSALLFAAMIAVGFLL